MSQFELISVLIPAYNHEKYIEKTLNSVLADDYPNKEIVIINDGSSDQTDEIIVRWISKHDSQIAVNYYSRANIGVTKTLNELVARSKGDYLTVIASDDYLLPGSLKARYDFLKSNPDKKAVFGDCIVVDENGEQTHQSGLADLHYAKKDRYLSDNGLKRKIILGWSVPGGTLMVDRNLYDEFQYDERYLIEDLDFFLKMVSKNLLGFIDVSVSAYRVHGDNACMIEKNWIKVQKDIMFSYLRNMKRFGICDKLLLFLPLFNALKPMAFYKIKKSIGLK